MDKFAITMGLLGGLALFLFGMEELAHSLKAVAGNRMKAVLRRLTSNRFMGVFTGAFVTAVIQSSSVTTVLVVGFISAGLMSLAQSVGVIMGANIGTTVTAQIIAFKVTHFALLLVASGYAVSFFGGRKWKQHGRMVLGLGLIFLGMMVMGDAMEPLRTHAPFMRWMGSMETPIFGILAGAAFTAVVQSSSATTAVVIVLAKQGVVSLPGGIALCMGANIGTCITALIASVGRPREALRASMVHVLFNVLGVLIWFGFIDHLVNFATQFSPSHEELEGSKRIAAEAPRQIANAHTVFNVANTLLLLPFAGLLARLVERMVPDRPMQDEAKVRAKYLDEHLLDTPSFALDHARLEILHMGNRVQSMLAEAIPLAVIGSKAELDALGILDDDVDALHGQVVSYLGKISQQSLSESQTTELLQLLEAANSLENIGDLIERSLVPLGRARIDANLQISPATTKVLQNVHAEVLKSYDAALLAVTQRNHEAAEQVLAMKPALKRMAEEAHLHELERLVANEPNRVSAYSIEVDLIEGMMRVFYFCRRMARAGRMTGS